MVETERGSPRWESIALMRLRYPEPFPFARCIWVNWISFYRLPPSVSSRDKWNGFFCRRDTIPVTQVAVSKHQRKLGALTTCQGRLLTGRSPSIHYWALEGKGVAVFMLDVWCNMLKPSLLLHFVAPTYPQACIISIHKLPIRRRVLSPIVSQSFNPQDGGSSSSEQSL